MRTNGKCNNSHAPSDNLSGTLLSVRTNIPEGQEHDIIVYIVMAEDRKNMRKFKQSKSNNSYIIDDTLMKRQMHNHTIVLYNQYTFHEIPSNSY